MISASIMLVAMQNIFWQRRGNGWPRMPVAFGFGLFHGLGFAGGLKEAMSQLPAAGLLTALVAFSIGIELGHQVVVLPLYMLLRKLRPRDGISPAGIAPLRWGSCGIFLAGGYFLVQALRA
jgi:hypothetical protein